MSNILAPYLFMVCDGKFYLLTGKQCRVTGDLNFSERLSRPGCPDPCLLEIVMTVIIE